MSWPVGIRRRGFRGPRFDDYGYFCARLMDSGFVVLGDAGADFSAAFGGSRRLPDVRDPPGEL